MDDGVIEALRDAQRFGFLGDRPVEEAADHALEFVRALGEVPSGARLIDLGSGGGLPGLVLASELPHVSIVLVDRRQKRTDFLQRAVRRLGWSHVEVRSVDAEELVREVAAGTLAPFDLVTARGFGPPAHTLTIASALVVVGGRIVISEPPSGDRWPPDLVAALGLRAERVGAVRVFTRVT